jgi:uncharacterized protein YcfL
MNKISFAFLLLPILIIACSSDEPTGFSDEQRQLIMGDTGNGVLTLGLQAPITINRDDVHLNLRELDMDGNSDVDVSILSYQDFFGDKGLLISTPNSLAKAQVAVDSDGFVRPYAAGETIQFESETWLSVEEAPLAVFVASDQSSTGLWNGTSNQYVAFRMQIENTRFLAWIELSVSDYDNYSFHNYGIKIVP